MSYDQTIPISFPGLNLIFNVNKIAFSIGPIQVRLYGILIVLGILFAIAFAITAYVFNTRKIELTIGKKKIRWYVALIAVAVLYAVIFTVAALFTNINNILFIIGELQIRWYGILIASGLLLALLYASRRLKEFKISIDDLTDVVLISTIFAIVCARLYYCIFYTDSTGAHPYLANIDGIKSILYIWDGGLAFYGSIIGGFVSAVIFCKIRKLNPLPFLDIAGLGFLIGQGIGRWGNFFNREAYGNVTTVPWRMVLDYTGIGYHPCFLYESLWCLLGFILLHFYSKHRKFNGELFLMYLGWNGLGRFFIEGFRSDSLWLITNYLKVSQLLAGILFIISAGILVFIHLNMRSKAAISGYEPVYKELVDDDENELTDETENSDEDNDSVSDEDINESSDEESDENINENQDNNSEHKSEE